MKQRRERMSQDDGLGFIGAGDERGCASSFLRGHVKQEATSGVTGSRPKAVGG
jgi:hypothetical protein